MPNQIIKLIDTTVVENSLSKLQGYKSLYYFWQQSSVEIANIEDNLWEHVLNINYAGRSPYAIAEYLDTYLKDNSDLKNWATKSSTIHDYFHPDYFPVNSVIADLSEDSVKEILLQFGAQQAVVLDIDSATEGSVYTFNFSQGLQEFVIPDSLDKKKQAKNFVPENYSKLKVEEIFTPELLKNVEMVLRGLSDQPTLWLLSGESVSAANANVFELVAKIWGAWRTDLPTINYFAIDKYQILNFLSKFSADFLKINFGLLFNLLPLTIVNVNKLPDKKTISVLDRQNSGLSIQKVRLLKSINIAYYQEEKTLFGIKGYLTLPGIVWFWRAAEINPLKPELLVDRFPQKRILKKINLNFDFLLAKQSRWEIELPTTLLRKMVRQKTISLPGTKMIQVVKNHIQLISEKDVSKLKITSGQKVAIGEPLLDNRNPLKALNTGNLYIKKGEISYLKLKSIQESKKDISWLESEGAKLERVDKKSIVVKIESLSRPVSKILGHSYSGVLVAAKNFSEAKILSENLTGIIIAVNERLTTKQIWQLIELGTQSLILPSFNADFTLPLELRYELSLVATSENSNDFSTELFKILLQKQGSEVFIDRVTNELKFLTDKQNAKFHLEKYKIPQEYLVKGTRVLTLRTNNLFKEAIVHHKEGKLLFLKQTNTTRLLSEDVENVTLI